MIVSREGQNTNSDPVGIYFNSDWHLLKIEKEGRVNITIPANNTSVQSADIAHGLGYTPFCFVYALLNGISVFLPTNRLEKSSISIGTWFKSNNEKIVIQTKVSSNIGTETIIEFYYFIFATRFT